MITRSRTILLETNETQGPTGPCGDPGPSGAQGPCGPCGPVGPSGPTGVQGDKGGSGDTGPVGPCGPAGPCGVGAVGGATTIGDGSNTEFTINHNSGTTELLIQVLDISTNRIVMAEIADVTISSFKVIFGSPPNSTQFQVNWVVIGAGELIGPCGMEGPCGSQGPEGPQWAPSGRVSYVGSSSSTVRVAHGLNNSNVFVQVREAASTYRQILTEIGLDSANSVRLSFGSAPSSNQYKAIITKPDYSDPIGDGVNTEYTVTHSLGTENVLIQVQEYGGDALLVIPEIRIVDSNSVKVIFGAAIEMNTYAVNVIAADSSQQIGDGANTEFTINHGLSTRDLFVAVRETGGDKRLVMAEIQYTDEDNIKVIFGSAPSTNQFTVVWTEPTNDAVLIDQFVLLDGSNWDLATGEHGNDTINFTCNELHSAVFFFPPLDTPPTPTQPGQAYFDTGDGVVYIWNGSSWTPITGPQGPCGLGGPCGAQGPIGPIGATGSIGHCGALGPCGSKGPTGPCGALGPCGAIGPCGEGPCGLAGPCGSQGSTGPCGALGPCGAAGNQGAVGPIGPTGPCGLSGPCGSKGPCGEGPCGLAGPCGSKGPTGPCGALGPCGAIGPCGEGPCGLAGPCGSQGSTGPCGALGPCGAVGNQGAVGSSGPIGPTGPCGALGPCGAKGECGSKGECGNKGPCGNQGSNGAQGASGPCGPAGPCGLQGLQGDKGSTGSTGSCGSTGPCGPVGPCGARGPCGLEGPCGAEGPCGLQGPTGPCGGT